MARYALPVIGAGIGFFVGGPAGAAWGWQIGSAAGSIVDPQTIKGPGVGDLARQTSQAGVPRPIVFGTSQPISGNLINCGEPRIVKSKSSGKGGPKVETESVYRTYSIRICEGPVDAILRVWRNNVLVYDARANGDLDDATNGKFLETARFFLGDYDQMPSPDLEAIFGVGLTPAHRGTCHMVQANEDLTDLRGAVPQWQFQVSRGRRVPVVAQGVLWPWLSGAVSDPRHPLGTYTYSTNDGAERAETGGSDKCTGSGEDIVGTADLPTLSGAIADLNSKWGGSRTYNVTPFAYSAEAHFNLTDSFEIPPTAIGDKDAPVSPYQRWIWLHHAIAGEEPNAVATKEVAYSIFLDPDTSNGYRIWTTPHGASLWTGWPNAYVVRKNISTLNSVWQFGVQYITGGLGPTCSGQHSAYVPASVRVELQPGPPNENAQRIEGTFRVLRTFIDAGGSANGSPQRFPVGPAISIEDERYDDQEFWEAAYQAALDAGTPNVSAGWTYGNQYPNAQDWAYFYYDQVDAETMPLTEIIDGICERAGLDPADFDHTALEDFHCWGLTVTNQYPAFTALQALGQVFMFDGANVGGTLKFVRRGGNTVETVNSDDFVDDQDENFEEAMRQDAIGVPKVMHLNYFDIAGGLATDKQSSTRPGNRRSIGEQSLSTAVLMDADTAARTVAIQHKVGIEELRGERKFALPDSFIALTVTDPVFVEWDGTNYYRLRLTSMDILDGYQQYTAVHDRQSNYTSEVEGVPAVPQTPPPSGVVGPTLLEIMDIHVLQDADDNVGLIYYGAVSGVEPAWQGALVELSVDGGANYIEGASTRAAAVMGELVTVLGDHPQEFPDTVHTVRVRIDTPDAELLASTLEGMLNRQNLALIGDELVNFAGVDEVTPGVWDLSFLLRGRKGSTTQEHAIGTRFVLLERPVLHMIPANLVDVGRTLTFRATSFGGRTEDATIVEVVYTGRSQIERAPGYLAAHRDGDNAVVTWQGVGRLGGGAQVAHGARFTGYRVTYDDGVNPAIVVDTAAQTHTQDVSGLDSPLIIRVQQVSSLMGAGPAAEVSLT